jgi:hypothetical protein
MLNFPFYNKHSNYLILDKNLRDYIKKSNTDSFNKFSEERQQYKNKNKNSNSNNSLLAASLINYRNYSDTFTNNQTEVSELEKEDYLCNFCDLSDCQDVVTSNSTNSTNTTNNTIVKKMYFLIGGTSAFIGIGIGFTVFYYKYSLFKK